eukprot:1100720-Prorocentrum_minimum.AAC.1
MRAPGATTWGSQGGHRGGSEGVTKGVTEGGWRGSQGAITYLRFDAPVHGGSHAAEARHVLQTCLRDRRRRDHVPAEGVTRGAQRGIRRGPKGGTEGKYRSSVDAHEPQNPTKSEEYQRYPQAGTYPRAGAAAIQRLRWLPMARVTMPEGMLMSSAGSNDGACILR